MNKESPRKFSRRNVLKMAEGVAGGILLSTVFPKRIKAEENIFAVNNGRYTVKLGDTLYKIARRYGLILEEIGQANPQINNSSLIEIDQKICVSGDIFDNKEPLIAPEKKEIKYPIYWGDRSQPEVALTFDDGFSKTSIERVLAAARKNNLQLTFFVIGQQLEAYPDLWRQAVKDGHQVCNHTHTHTYLTGLDNEEIKGEMLGWEQAARNVLGKKYLERMKNNFSYIRFPGGAGHKTERVLQTVEEMGYMPIAWSQDTYGAVLKKHQYLKEPAKPIADEVEQYTVKTAQNGSIILFHFNVWDTLDLEETVAGIREKSLEIKNVTGVLV